MQQQQCTTEDSIFYSQNSAFNHFQEEQGVVGWWVGGCWLVGAQNWSKNC